jgi:hypothetical protein
MNTFREELHRLADDAPHVDLARPALRTARRRRATALALTVTAVVAVLTGGTILVGGMRVTRPIVIAPPVTVAAPLPASGVDPAESAYVQHCGLNAVCEDDRWRVVTTGGMTYRLTGAGRSGPVAITQDGRRIAYYSEGRRTFEVRDLESGEVWRAPTEITKSDLEGENFLRLSPDGLQLIYTNFGGGSVSVLVDLVKQRTTELDRHWFPLSVGDGGRPVALARPYEDTTRLRVLGNKPVTIKSFTYDLSALGPDGRSVVRVVRMLDRNATPMLQRTRTIATTDAVTGVDGAPVPVRGVPAELQLGRLGSWLSATEVSLLAVPSEPRSGRTATLYAVNVHTGEARELRDSGQEGNVVMPGLVR